MEFFELLKGIAEGNYGEGDMFESTSGSKLIYKEGVLHWVTSGGYVGTPLILNGEVISEQWTKKTDSTIITFLEALPLIHKGIEVKIKVGTEDAIRYYPVDSLDELDRIISKKEYLDDLYVADVFVEKSDLPIDITNNISQHFVIDDSRAVVSPALNIKEAFILPKVRKGRKLEYNEAYEIHHKYHFAKKGVPQLAKEYDVSERMIYYVLDGTHWEAAHTAFHEEYCVVKDDYMM